MLTQPGQRRACEHFVLWGRGQVEWLGCLGDRGPGGQTSGGEEPHHRDSCSYALFLFFGLHQAQTREQEGEGLGNKTST